MAAMDKGRILWLVSIIVAVQGYSYQTSYPADKSYLYTDIHYTYTNFFDVVTKDFFTFRLRACSDGHVILAKASDDDSLRAQALEVVISGWQNTQSVIRRAINGPHLVEADTTDMLHCAEFRQFWISWRRGLVRFGRGPLEGTETILSISQSDEIGRDFLVIGISTGYDYAGTWEVEENNALGLTVASPPNEKYELIWKTVEYKSNFYNFMAAACSDINIALGSSRGKIDYNLVVGGWGNTKTVLRKWGEEKEAHEEEGVCHCDTMRAYWVSWDGGRIEFGQGHLKGGYRLINWFDVDPVAITAIGFTTASGHAGVWYFNEDLENHFVFLREPLSDNNALQFYNWIISPRYESVSFLVSACHDVFLMLAAQPSNTGVEPVDALADDNMFIIYVGTDGNRKSGIRRSMIEAPLIEVDTGGLLQCLYPMPIWVHWRDNKIEVGLGNGKSQGIPPFITYDIPANLQFDIQTLGLGSILSNDVRYMVSKIYGDQVHLFTPESERYQHTWVTTHGDYFVTFEVQTCMRTYVHLCKWLGDTAGSLYGIDFAYEDDPNKISLYRSSNRTVYDRGLTLSCDETEPFWVSWTHGHIKLGKGTRYNKDLILSLASGEMYAVNALSLHSPRSVAQFKFDTDMGDYVAIPTLQSSYVWVEMMDWVSWLFLRVSGRTDATLVLSDSFMSDAHSHSITFNGPDERKAGRDLQPFASEDHQIADILNTGMSTDVWVSWTDDGYVEVGKGRLRGVDRKLQFTDKDFKVKALGFTTYNENNEWQILHSQGYQVYYETVPSDDYYMADNLWLSVAHRTGLVFDVQACSNAWVVLSSVIHSSSFNYSYHIEIQNSTNDGKTRLLLNDLYDRVVVNTADAISCTEERYFWVSWLGGHIALGRGQEIGNDRFLSWHDPNPFVIRGLSVRSSKGQRATWRFPLHRDRSLDGRPGEGGGLSGGAVAGIVIGVLLAVIIAGAVVFVVLRGVPDPIRNVIPTSFGGGGAGSNSAGGASGASKGPSLPDRQMSFENPVQFENTMDY